jgi:hypothetical protein
VDESCRDRGCQWAWWSIRIIAVLVLLYSLLVLIGAFRSAQEGDSGSAWAGGVFALVDTALGLFLITRPMPSHPARAAIGAALSGVGGVWMGLSAVNPGTTWAILYALLPDGVAGLLVGAGLHRAWAGLFPFGAGIWAVVAATEYGPDEEAMLIAATARRRRGRRRAQFVVRIVAAFLFLDSALWAVNAMQEAIAGGRYGAWMGIFLATVRGGFAAYLVTRPRPDRPVRAVVGGVLVAIGGIHAPNAALGLTSLMIYELFGPRVGGFLLDIGADGLWVGVVLLSTGIWATVSANDSKHESVPTRTLPEVPERSEVPEVPERSVESDFADDPKSARDGRWALRLVRIIGVFVLLYAVVTMIYVASSSEAVPAGDGAIIAWVEVLVGLFLVTRRAPSYPIQAVVGAILVGVGGLWTAFALANVTAEWRAWPFRQDLLARLLVDTGAHMGQVGMLTLAVGVWASYSATSRRRRHVPVVLYEPDEETEAEATISLDLTPEE